MDIFTTVKSSIDNKELAQFYLGNPVKKSGSYNFYKSPFRNERTASFAVTQRGFVDFGSNWRGDCIKFVAELFNLKPMEAAKKISQDFNLGITKNNYIVTEKQSNFHIIKGLKLWRNRTLDKLTNMYRLCKELSKDPELAYELAEVEANLDLYTDILILGNETDWYTLYRKLGWAYAN